MAPSEVARITDPNELDKVLADRMGLEIPRYNNGTPLGTYVISLYPARYIHQDTGERLPLSEFTLSMERVLRLEWAIKTLGLKASPIAWLLMSVAN